MLHSFGHWLLNLLKHRFAPTVLALVAFLDSVAIKFPADVLLAPMAFVKPRSWAKLAALTTVASILGGITMFLIGSLVFDTLGQMALDGFGLQDTFKEFVRQHANEGPMAIIFASLAFVPYKAIALACGVVEMPFWQFLLMSVVIRGVRYFVVAFIAALAGRTLFGDEAQR